MGEHGVMKIGDKGWRCRIGGIIFALCEDSHGTVTNTNVNVYVIAEVLILGPLEGKWLRT